MASANDIIKASLSSIATGLQAGPNAAIGSKIMQTVANHLGLPVSHPLVSKVANHPDIQNAAAGQRPPIRIPERDINYRPIGSSGNAYGELKAYGIDIIAQGSFTAAANEWGTGIPTGAAVDVLQEGVIFLWSFTAESDDYNAVFITESTWNTKPYSIPAGSKVNGGEFSFTALNRFVPKPLHVRPGDKIRVNGTAVAAANKYDISYVGVEIDGLGGMAGHVIEYLAHHNIAAAKMVMAQRAMVYSFGGPGLAGG